MVNPVGYHVLVGYETNTEAAMNGCTCHNIGTCRCDETAAWHGDGCGECGERSEHCDCGCTCTPTRAAGLEYVGNYDEE